MVKSWCILNSPWPIPVQLHNKGIRNNQSLSIPMDHQHIKVQEGSSTLTDEIIFQLLTVSSYIAGIYTKYMKRLWYNKTVVLFKKSNRNVLLAVFILELSVLIKSLMFFFTMITLYVIFIIIFQFALMIYKKKIAISVFLNFDEKGVDFFPSEMRNIQ